MVRTRSGSEYHHNEGQLSSKSDWDRLPLLVQWKILELLDSHQLEKLSRVSPSIREQIEWDVGINIFITPKGLKSGVSYMKRRLIDCIKEGQRIRRLLIDGLPTSCDPLPFKRIIFRDPHFLRDVELSRVDFSIVHKIVTKCKNIEKLGYSVGSSGIMLDKDLISAHHTWDDVTLPKLTCLQLNVVPNVLNSNFFAPEIPVEKNEWISLLLVLLKVKAPKLKELTVCHSLCDTQIFQRSCLFPAMAQLLSSSGSKLQRFSYNSLKLKNYQLDLAAYRTDFSKLIKAYGNELALLVWRECKEGGQQRGVEFTNAILQSVPGRLKQLGEVTIGLANALEVDALLQLLQSIEGVYKLTIQKDHILGEERRQRIFQFFQDSNQNQPICHTVVDLKIIQMCSCLRCITRCLSLPKLLRKFRRLEKVKFDHSSRAHGRVRTTVVEEHAFQEVEIVRGPNEQNQPVLARIVRTVEYQVFPDLSLCNGIVGEKFPNLREIILYEMAVIKNDYLALTQYAPNLTKLQVTIPTLMDEREYALFGVSSSDLLQILRMRKLDLVQVENVIFPDARFLSDRDRAALKEIGKLRRGMEVEDDEEWTIEGYLWDFSAGDLAVIGEDYDSSEEDGSDSENE